VSVDLFIPTVWSSKILHRLKIALAFGSPYCVNHDYEGDIAEYGDSVKIHGISDPTISDYTKNSTDLSSPEVLSAFENILLINQGDYFNFIVDDVDKRQVQPQFTAEAMDRAGYGLALEVDKFVAAEMLTAVVTATDASGESVAAIVGTTGSPVPIHGAGQYQEVADATATAAYEFLVDLGVTLDNQKIPRQADRFCVVPPWFTGELSKDYRFVGINGAGGNQVLQDGFAGQAEANGLAGRAAGFNVITSLDSPSGTFNGTSAYKVGAGSDNGTYSAILAGVPSATSFANQIIQTEALRSQKAFGDILRGLHVYGSKVVWPSRLAAAYVAIGS
jgi:hypothetical protein